ncbi:hypothetical protein BKG83_20675 [Mycobacteroides chelonae]|jgi:hypothetical protein|nr:hypothetical protein BKG83_20675 [Mycobacteroides chelonae]SKO32194.1 Uncharacterised protein [Mycobacteroides abscessus subsp. bolletii]
MGLPASIGMGFVEALCMVEVSRFSKQGGVVIQAEHVSVLGAIIRRMPGDTRVTVLTDPGGAKSASSFGSG